MHTYWCPDCKRKLRELTGGFECFMCGNVFPLKNGFCVFDNSDLVNCLDYGLDKLILDIENEELVSRLYRYFIPHLDQLVGGTILSVGCGAGGDIEQLNRLESEAYGMDFLYRTTFWQAKGYSKYWFFVSSTDSIPFPVEYFDVILCTGVIEHVEEALVSKKDYFELDRKRRHFLKTLFDLLKPAGTMIITSPNRNFPLDFQHDAYRWFPSLARFSIHPHSCFTRFLESYYSLSRHFRKIGKHTAEPMPLVNFCGLNVVKLSSQLTIFKRLFDVYIRVLDKMPNVIRKLFLNPYIVLKITKLR